MVDNEIEESIRDGDSRIFVPLAARRQAQEILQQIHSEPFEFSLPSGDRALDILREHISEVAEE